MLWAFTPLLVMAAEDAASRPFAHPGEVPEERLYARIDDLGGPVIGRYRRRRAAEFLAWELPDATIVRYQRIERDAVVEDHRFDASGWPLTTLTATAAGPMRIDVRTRPPVTLDLIGWEPHPIPAGQILAPSAPAERAEGGVRLTFPEGELDIWREARAADVYGQDFRDGLLAGCGCIVLDRATAWVDGRPGARYRLLVPGAEPPDGVDVWAVPLDDGLWLATYRVPSPEDPQTALAAGRALLALVSLGQETP